MSQSPPPRFPIRKFTVAEVETMVEAGILEADERVELIEGELVPMSPKGRRHEEMKIALLRRWYGLRLDAFEIVPETTFRLSIHTYIEPDFVIYPHALGLKDLSSSNVLLAVEIADSSLRYDQGRKAALYASFGIGELWVIDAVAMTTRAFRSPSPDGYLDIDDHAAAERVVPRFAPGEFALTLDDLDSH
jgi:Uma2 family endonuclease